MIVNVFNRDEDIQKIDSNDIPSRILKIAEEGKLISKFLGKIYKVGNSIFFKRKDDMTEVPPMAQNIAIVSMTDSNLLNLS